MYLKEKVPISQNMATTNWPQSNGTSNNQISETNQLDKNCYDHQILKRNQLDKNSKIISRQLILHLTSKDLILVVS